MLHEDTIFVAVVGSLAGEEGREDGFAALLDLLVRRQGDHLTHQILGHATKIGLFLA